MESTIPLTVNGKKHAVATDPQRPLLDVLREELGLTGTKYGCGEGRCGACTVLLDGKPVHACRTPVAEAGGKAITTIEGLAANGALHPVQEAFLAEGAMQCGYCTPGMIVTAAALLERTPHPSDQEILDAMDGNVCRCNGYVKILRAIRRAAGRV
jgi:aerobic-type carbon monoxide dehydrogenase small subunit (CoxS/CutS family)